MDWLTSSTFRNVLIGTSLLGTIGGATGVFAVLRRQSLLGDALAHAALPGVCLAYLLVGAKSSPAILAGAAATGLLGALVMLAVARGSRVKEDSAMGIVLSVFFGVGIVLLTYIQKTAHGNQAGLDRFLFGQAVTLLGSDLVLFAVVGAAVLACILLFYKELKLLCFDREFAASIGLPTRFLEVLLTVVLVAVVVVGLQTVGVVLTVAALVTPAAAARQWTDRFSIMLLLAATIGAFSSAAGATLSGTIDRMPTGPTIVVVASAILALSTALAPRRGVVWAFVRHRRLARRIRRENLLNDLYRCGESTGSWEEAVPRSVLMGFRGQRGGVVDRTAQALAARRLVETVADGLRLTPSGLVAAQRVVRKHRLWELYLTRRLDLPADHVHRDAEEMEHALSDEAVREFARILGHPTHDPHGRAIPNPDGEGNDAETTSGRGAR